MIKLPCEVCSIIKNVEFHHPDYSKPLEGNWVCSYHHKLIHKILKVLKELGYIYYNSQWNKIKEIEV